MRLFQTTVLALFACVSTAFAGSYDVNFTSTPVPYQAIASFGDFTVSAAKGPVPQMLATDPYGLGIYSDGTNDNSMGPKEAITFEFAPLPVRRVVFNHKVLEDGTVWIRVRTTAGLESSVAYQAVDDWMEIGPYSDDLRIVSITIESSSALFSIRSVSYEFDRFVPGDTLELDNANGNPFEPQCAYFYGVAGMTLELEMFDCLPTTRGLVTIRRLDGIVDAETVFTKLGKRSVKLNSSGWFEWSYRSLDGIIQNVTFRTRAVFKKNDATVVRTVAAEWIDLPQGAIDVPAIAGMTIDLTVTSALGSTSGLMFDFGDASGQSMQLDAVSMSKKGVLKLAPIVTPTSGAYALTVMELKSKQVATVTIKRSMPAPIPGATEHVVAIND